jgi:thiol-disulfide isomerase/thioredoxin
MARLAIFVMLAMAASAKAAMEIQAADFKNEIGNYKNAFVMFHAPWCSHCVAAKPSFEKIESHVDTLTVDASVPEAEHLMKEYDIKGYPTFVFFEDGEAMDKYDGGRDTGDFEQYLMHKVKAPEPAAVATDNDVDNDAEL